MRRGRFYSTDLLHEEAGLAKWEVRARLAGMRLMFKYEFKEGFKSHQLSYEEDNNVPSNEGM